MKKLALLLVSLALVTPGVAQLTHVFEIRARVNSDSPGWPHPVGAGDLVKLTIGFNATLPDLALADNVLWSHTPDAMWRLELGDYFAATSFPGTTFEVGVYAGHPSIDIFVASPFTPGPVLGWGERDIRVRRSEGMWFPSHDTFTWDTLLNADLNVSPFLLNELNWGFFSGQDFTAEIESINIRPLLTPVPEPSTYGAVAALLMIAFACVRVSRHSGTRPVGWTKR